MCVKIIANIKEIWMRRFFLTLFALFLLLGCSKKETQSVTIYVSEDQVFSEPVLQNFEKETGIKVNALYDTEESKGTGVMNRLIAEKNHPQADLYWANEPIRAEVLKAKGILTPYKSPNAKTIDARYKDPQGYWSGFSARLRLFVVNKNAKSSPKSIFDYIDPHFKNRAVIANPLFGSTATHIAALFTLLGEKKATNFLDGLKQNGVALSTSNGESADLVAQGRYDFALVDSDDAISRIQKGSPIKIVYPDQGQNGLGVLVIPNAVMLIKNAPHPQAAKKLMDYLLSPKTEAALAKAKCAQIPLHPGVAQPTMLKPIQALKVMHIRYSEVAHTLVKITPLLDKWSQK